MFFISAIILSSLSIDLAAAYSPDNIYSQYTTYPTPSKDSNLRFCLVLAASLVFLYVPTKFLLYSVRRPSKQKEKRDYTTISATLSHVTDTIMTGYDHIKSKYLSGSPSSLGRPAANLSIRKLSQRAVKHGGNVGGLVNDGNTCFMNCVLQSLASSYDFTQFLDQEVAFLTQLTEGAKDSTNAENKPKVASEIFEKIGLNSGNGKDKPSYFIYALFVLLSKLNSKHGKRNSDYTVNSLVKRMAKGFEKHSFLGYNQEDAQEFFQLVLSNIERESKELHASEQESKENNSLTIESKESETKYITIGKQGINELNSKLTSIGTYYIPATQIDPSLEAASQKAFKFKFITPADGLSVERIGCLKCGETGGLRYSVSSGLSLSLPSDSSAYKSFGYSKSSIELDTLLQQYIEKEVIEEVECNRCSLEYVIEILREQLKSPNVPDVLKQKYSERVELIKKELTKPIITDEAANAYKSKNIKQKGKKSKQAFLSKPPAYLSLHFNRSVFDLQTGYVRKNNCNIDFPMKLDLNPYVASYEDVNVDARLSMRKQDDISQEKKNVISKELEKLKKVKLQASTSEDVAAAAAAAAAEGSDDQAYKDDSEQSKSLSSGSVQSEIFEETATSHNLSDSITDVDEAEPSKLNLGDAKKAISEELKNKLMGLNAELGKFYKPELVYDLKAVIVHYGTHNYGHYIAFRKFRGVWWRISDETVEVVTENQVLQTPGVFMLFYECHNSFEEQYEEESDVQKGDSGSEGSNDDDNNSSDSDDSSSSSERPFKVEIDPEAMRNAEGRSGDSSEDELYSNDGDDTEEVGERQRDETIAIATPSL